MKTYKIPLTWQMGGMVYIKANSLKEAYQKANDGETALPKGKNQYYIEDSWENESIESVKEINAEKRA